MKSGLTPKIMAMRERFGKRSKQKGVEIIEFALLAPIIFVILFGIIEFSLALYNQAILTNASREGARLGILWTNNLRTSEQVEGDMENRAREVSDVHVISFNPSATINPACELEEFNAACTVTFNHRFLVLSPLMSLINGRLSADLTLGSTTIMKRE